MSDINEATSELLDYVDLIEEPSDEEEPIEPLEEEEDPQGDAHEDDEEEDDSEDDPEEEEAEEEPLISITIGDEEYEVNLEELKSGYLRNEEFVSKKTKLDELVSEKEYELLTEREKLVTEYNRLLLEDGVNIQQYKNVDWNKLRQQNPEAYREWRIKYVEAQEALQGKLKRRDQIAQLHMKQQEIRHNAYVEKQAKLAQELIPELEDPTFMNELIAYGETAGFTRDEVLNISEAKQLYILKQAMDNSKSKVARAGAASKKDTPIPKVVKPGSKVSKSAEALGNRKVLREKLNSTHSMKDAANLLMDFL